MMAMDMKRKMDAASKMVEVMDMIAGDRIKEQMSGEKPEEANENEDSEEMSEMGMSKEECASPVDAAKKSMESMKPKLEGDYGQMAVEIEIEKKKPKFPFQKPGIERA